MLPRLHNAPVDASLTINGKAMWDVSVSVDDVGSHFTVPAFVEMEKENVRLHTWIAKHGTIKTLTGITFCIDCGEEWEGDLQRHRSNCQVLASAKVYNATQRENSGG